VLEIVFVVYVGSTLEMVHRHFPYEAVIYQADVLLLGIAPFARFIFKVNIYSDIIGVPSQGGAAIITVPLLRTLMVYEVGLF
jgi:hypothetical protein